MAMSMLKTLSRCYFGPKLYRIHGQDGRNGGMYQPNIVEFVSDKVINTMSVCWSLSFWLSPVISIVLYRRGYFCLEGLGSIGKLSLALTVIYSTAIFTRGLGRFVNGEYVNLLKVLNGMKQAPTPELKKQLQSHDFDFSAWPADYVANSTCRSKPEREKRESVWSRLVNLPSQALGYALIHSFGRGMIYPGSTSILNTLLFNTLLEYRGKLIEDKRALRGKVQTGDGNYVDTLFVDGKKVEGGQNADTLVLTCEGNAAFYEIGCMVTPIEAGYSVLGWNRPGFSQSSGKPYTEMEHHAADSVMQYAIHKLGFLPQNIILFAWSIGGYDAAYLASSYPEVKALILDATFDDIVPLAVSKMPQFAGSIIKDAIRDHLNLHVSSLVNQYSGPVLLIRRTLDEMITVGEGQELATNRGNHLLMDVLKCRYPRLVDGDGMSLLHQYVANSTAGQKVMLESYDVNPDTCLMTLKSFTEPLPYQFPLMIGEEMAEHERHQLLLYLAHKHMEDFASTHCSPLPTEYFHLPWSIQTAVDVLT